MRDVKLYLTGGGNFRFDIATVKPYKGNRKQEKPFYLPSVRKYLETKWGAVVVEGMEADDALCIVAGRNKYDLLIDADLIAYEAAAAADMVDEGFERRSLEWTFDKADEIIENIIEACSGDDCGEGPVIASRDKDLRQYPCMQYSWEVGNQPEWGPEMVEEIGDIDVTLVDKLLKSGEPSKAIKKISGTGLTWFYTQCITGDSTDNIPGLEGKGAGLAYELLKGLGTEADLFKATLGAYSDKYGEDAEERLLEQGRLLWMCRSKIKGEAVMWEFPL